MFLDKNKDNTKGFRLDTSKKILLRCDKCGAPMRVTYGCNYHYYVCTKKITSKGVYCDNKNVKGPDIEKVVVGSILDIDTDMLLANLNSDELGVSSMENDIKDIQSKIKSKKLWLNSLFDRMADFDDDLKNRKFMLGVIIDKIRWNGDTEKIDIEFWGSKKNRPLPSFYYQTVAIYRVMHDL